MADQIGTYEAKTKFASLVKRVERGEEVLITRRGTPVVKMVPIAKADRAKVDEAIEQLRQARKGVRLDGLKIKDLINEGRR